MKQNRLLQEQKRQQQQQQREMEDEERKQREREVLERHKQRLMTSMSIVHSFSRQKENCVEVGAVEPEARPRRSPERSHISRRDLPRWVAKSLQQGFPIPEHVCLHYGL